MTTSWRSFPTLRRKCRLNHLSIYIIIHLWYMFEEGETYGLDSWIVMIRCDWLVLRWTTALETKWYHSTPSSPSEIPQPHPNTATWYGSEMLTLDNIGTVWHYALQWCKATMIMTMTHSLTDLMATAWWCIGEAVGLMLHSSQVPLSSKCSLCSYVLVFLCINDVL